MRPAAVTAVAIVVCAALLAAGCGGGSSGGSNTTAPEGGGANGAADGTPKKATSPNAPAGSKVVDCKVEAASMGGLRATAVDCGLARRVMGQWRRNRSCALGDSDSRGSCSLGPFRCQAVRTDEGAVVSCARPGADVSFVKTNESR